MGIIDREYMYETKTKKQSSKIKQDKKKKRVNQLWNLYRKEHKNIFDRLKIKVLELQNRKS